MTGGIDLARLDNPEAAAAVEAMKEQLLIAFLKRLGGKVRMPVKEVDDTGDYVFILRLDGTVFEFSLRKKQ